MRNALLFLIRTYQKIPGPWHGLCRHIPTCSNYAMGAIERYGCCYGLWLSIKRIIRCNPLGSKGYDPVPVIRRNKK